MDIVILTNMPTPYRIPVFELLSEKVNKVTIAYCIEKESNRKWDISLDNKKVNYYNLKTKTIDINGKYIHLSTEIFKFIIKNRNSVFIIGDASYNSYIAVIIMKLLGVKYILWTGWTESSFTGSKIGKYLKKKMILNSSAILSYGTYTEKVLKKYSRNIPILNLNNCVDNNYFLKLKKEYPKRLKKTGIFRLVCTGQLIERKNILSIINAVSKFDNVELILIGTGTTEYQLKIDNLIGKLNAKVKIMGNLEPKEIYKIYSEVDCFILASLDEPWGLVVNEALLYGLPVIVSKNVGCHYDIVNKNNGLVVDNDADSIFLAIQKIMDLSYNNEEISNNFKNISSPDYSVNKILQSVKYI